MRDRFSTLTSLTNIRVQLLTALVRVGAILATSAFLLSVPSFLIVGNLGTLPVYFLVVLLFWVMALGWRLPYAIRGGLLIASMYLLGVIELLTFSYSADGHAYLIAGTLFGALFFDRRVGVGVLILTAFTLLGVGWLIASGHIVVWAFLFRPVDSAVVLGTASVFICVAGTLQHIISLLLTHLDVVLQHERALRDQLEVRVSERTESLAKAHQHVSAINRELDEQRGFLAALHETSLDLLNHRHLDDLLHAIVTRASEVLATPCCEILLPEADTLVVKACTPNLTFLLGERVRRDEARLSWQAYETGQPVVVNDYASLPDHRVIYDQVAIHAVLELPIMIGTTCHGVLSLSRSADDYPYTAQDIWKGQLFVGLIALVLENGQLYDAAQHEIAWRVEIEQELRAMTQMLQAQNADLDAFGRTVAHDLKTPVTVIIGHAQLLAQSYHVLDRATIDRDLQVITQASIKMASIINELLLLAQVRDAAALAITPLAMGSLIQEATRRLAQPIAETQAAIVGPRDWPIALGYAPWVEVVWVNYISNAIKYGGSPPSVEVGADPPAGGMVRFWVRDNGPGIPKEQQATLFEAFTRLQPERVDGHGLGLSIVRRIIEKLGGAVGIESTLGMGSTFFFTLPASHAVVVAPPVFSDNRTSDASRADQVQTYPVDSRQLHATMPRCDRCSYAWPCYHEPMGSWQVPSTE